MGGGYSGQVETALCIAARLSTQELVRNSYLGGFWGQEESGVQASLFYRDIASACMSLSPVKPSRYGGEFCKPLCPMTASCSIHKCSITLQIAVNGSHYCGFRHRVPKERITHLVIEGGVHVHSIQYQGQRPNPQVTQKFVRKGW